MTRLIIPALVALLVSGPAWAEEEDPISGHRTAAEVKPLRMVAQFEYDRH